MITDTIQSELDTLTSEREVARAALVAAESVATTHADARTAYQRYELRLARLGTKPDAEDAPVPPETPDGERPTDHEIVAAQRIIRDHQQFVGGIAVAEDAVVTATKRVETAQEEAKRAAATATRMKALVDALRRAPGVIAREQVALFGDLGPVAIDFPVPTEGAGNPPAVVITVNGLPLSVASDGELVDASLRLRLALRRISGMREIPVVVDRANLLNGGNGPWPEDEGVVYLVTSDGDTGLTVRPGVPGAA